MNNLTNTTQENPPLALLKKLGVIYSKIEPIGKDGYNKDQGYKFTPETALKASLMPLFREQGILMKIDVKSIGDIDRGTSGSGNAKFLTRVTLTYTFIDTQSGESLTGQFIGDGFDSLDKGVWKAITGSVKYILFELFLIPTNDDPENDNVEKTRTVYKQTTTTAKPATPPIAKPKPSDLICAVTGDTITEAEYDYSMRIYKMPLGRKAQAEAKAEKDKANKK